MDLWQPSVMFLACFVVISLLSVAGASRAGERRVSALIGHGWDPDPRTKAAARRELARREIYQNLTAICAMPLGLLLDLRLEAASGVAAAWCTAAAWASGYALGAVAHHVGLGRIRRGPRVAEMATRRMVDYVGRWAALVWFACGAATMTLVVLMLREPTRGAFRPDLREMEAVLLLAAVVWLVFVGLCASLVLRRPLPASAPDDLVWREWSRALTLSDLTGAVGIAPFLAGSGALLRVWDGGLLTLGMPPGTMASMIFVAMMLALAGRLVTQPVAMSTTNVRSEGTSC